MHNGDLQGKLGLMGRSWVDKTGVYLFCAFRWVAKTMSRVCVCVGSSMCCIGWDMYLVGLSGMNVFTYIHTCMQYGTKATHNGQRSSSTTHAKPTIPSMA